jgi:anti-anti-sigma factor
MHLEDGLSVDVRRSGTSATVVARGELDLATGGELRTAAQAAAEGAGRVVVDLRALTLIDSSGLGVLLNLRGELQREGVEFVVEVDDGPVRQALVATGLSQLLAV